MAREQWVRRFSDYVREHFPVRPNDTEYSFSVLHRKSVVIVADGIQHYLGDQDIDTSDLTFKKIPNVAPPFEKYFVECGYPVKDRDYRKWGIQFWVVPTNLKDEANGIKWTVKGMSLLLGAKNDDRVYITPGTYTIYIKEDGTIDRAEFNRGKITGRPDINEIIPDLDLGMHTRDAKMVMLALIAISFMHCRNVTVIDNHPPQKLQQIRQRKKKEPLVKFKTLEISGITKILNEQGGVNIIGLGKALHICRGHFRTYTSDRPLFGRVTGQIWVPQHARGSAEYGEIRKDYVVKPKAAEKKES